KPSTSWPMSLDDLIEKMSKLNIDEVFLQPFDLDSKFYTEAISFIKQYLKLIINSDQEVVELYKEYVVKAIRVITVFKLLQGDFLKLNKLVEEFKDLSECFPMFER